MPLIPLHRTLTDRSAADAHPVSAITGLSSSLSALTLQVPASNGWSGPSLVVSTGSGVAQYGIVHLDAAGVWQVADLSSEGTADGLLGVVVSAVVGNAATIGLSAGIVRNSAWTFTPGGAVYLHASGGLSQSAVTGSGNVSRRLGYALAASAFYFAPSVALTLL